MCLRMTIALTPRSHELPEWAFEVKNRLHEKEANAREQKVAEQRKAATVQESNRLELYSPAAFQKTLKRVLLDSDESDHRNHTIIGSYNSVFTGTGEMQGLGSSTHCGLFDNVIIIE